MNRRFRSVAAAALAGFLVLSLGAVPAAAKDTQKGRWLKIRVYENGSSTPTVLVNLPMGFVSAAVKILARGGSAHATIDGPIEGSSEGGKTKVRLRDVDLEALLGELESMAPGQIVEVQEDDERVSIWIE
jgi:hypothetical protein